MKRLLKIASVLTMLIIGMSNACADSWHGRGARDAQREERQMQRQEQYGYGRRQYEQGDREPYAAPEPSHRRGNMTPEERRALRQQIHDAGREVYPPNR
jgi:hypothetical protein